MSTSHVYKKFVRVLDKWPLDPLKSHSRNLKPFLEKEFERIYKVEAAHTPVDIANAERQLRGWLSSFRLRDLNPGALALEDLVANKHLKDVPHNYTSGIFGCTREQVQQCNSSDMRQKFGFGKESLLRRIFRFGRSKAED